MRLRRPCAGHALDAGYRARSEHDKAAGRCRVDAIIVTRRSRRRSSWVIALPPRVIRLGRDWHAMTGPAPRKGRLQDVPLARVARSAPVPPVAALPSHARRGARMFRPLAPSALDAAWHRRAGAVRLTIRPVQGVRRLPERGPYLGAGRDSTFGCIRHRDRRRPRLPAGLSLALLACFRAFTMDTGPGDLLADPRQGSRTGLPLDPERALHLT